MDSRLVIYGSLFILINLLLFKWSLSSAYAKAIHILIVTQAADSKTSALFVMVAS